MIAHRIAEVEAASCALLGARSIGDRRASLQCSAYGRGVGRSKRKGGRGTRATVPALLKTKPPPRPRWHVSFEGLLRAAECGERRRSALLLCRH